MKLHADRAYLPGGLSPVPLLYPLWGVDPPRDAADPSSGRYDAYLAVGRDLFELVPLVDAEAAIFPASWGAVSDDEGAVALARRLAAEAAEAGVPACVFYWHDSAAPLPVDGVWVFRTSLYRSRRRPHEFAQPAWSEDLLERYWGGELQVRPKRERPVVGFCGNAPGGSAPRRLVRRVRGVGDGGVRRRALAALARSSEVETNFIVRGGFWGADRPGAAAADPLVVRREYVANLLASDYGLCVRGNGNFSYRLYETLSLGRIPVFVDTDCVLPYEDLIPWRELCVWVDGRDLGRIGERVAAFHGALADGEFEELQRRCRRVWLEWLSPQGWFANFHRHFV